MFKVAAALESLFLFLNVLQFRNNRYSRMTLIVSSYGSEKEIDYNVIDLIAVG